MTGPDSTSMTFPDGDLPDAIVASRRAGAATRALIGNLVGSRASAADLEAAAAAIEAVNERLAPHAATTRFADFPPARGEVLSFGPRTQAIFEHHPFVGPSNPLAPPMQLERGPTGAIATVTYDHRHEGIPGMVHGGVLAAAFDLVLAAAAAAAAERPAPTGTLSIRYRRPTRLHTPLRYEAHVTRTGGRTLQVEGTVSDGDGATAEADGVFVIARAGTIPTVGIADA
jgi:acyl-coenzyme A thioesterase PaaI-like protein